MATGRANPNAAVQAMALHGKCILGYVFKNRVLRKDKTFLTLNYKSV